jgi:hypothetical protein
LIALFNFLVGCKVAGDGGARKKSGKRKAGWQIAIAGFLALIQLRPSPSDQQILPSLAYANRKAE